MRLTKFSSALLKILTQQICRKLQVLVKTIVNFPFALDKGVISQTIHPLQCRLCTHPYQLTPSQMTCCQNSLLHSLFERTGSSQMLP